VLIINIIKSEIAVVMMVIVVVWVEVFDGRFNGI